MEPLTFGTVWKRVKEKYWQLQSKVDTIPNTCFTTDFIKAEGSLPVVTTLSFEVCLNWAAPPSSTSILRPSQNNLFSKFNWSEKKGGPSPFFECAF